MNNQRYEYSVIRYVHDASAGECLNVGVIIGSQGGDIKTEYLRNFSRIKSAFPEASIKTIKSSLGALASRIEFHRSNEGSFSEILSSAFPEDDGYFKASQIGVGVAGNVDAALDELMDRFVRKCNRDFYNVQVTKNSEPRITWGHGSEMKPPAGANESSYKEAEVIKLRA